VSSVYEFRRVRHVEFAETDAAGLVHFASYYCYMEETEHAFARSLGLSIPLPKQGEARVSFPRLAARCEFLRPIHFGDEVEIHLRVARRGTTSMTYQHLFRSKGEIVARGEVVVVCCLFHGDGRMERTPWPSEYAVIAEAPYEPLKFRPNLAD